MFCLGSSRETNSNGGSSNGYPNTSVSGDPGSDPSFSSGDEEEEEDYKGLLEALVKKWLNVQLTHEVSASATEAFWKTAMDFIPKLAEHRSQNNINKNVPGYKHLRSTLYKDYCPKIYMTFAYMKKSDNTIEIVECEKAPRRPKSQYIKLYEEAHIKVKHLHNSLSTHIFHLSSSTYLSIDFTHPIPSHPNPFIIVLYIPFQFHTYNI